MSNQPIDNQISNASARFSGADGRQSRCVEVSGFSISMYLRCMQRMIPHSFHLTAITVLVVGFASPRAGASVLMLYGNVHRQAFDESGKVFLNVNSRCTLGIDTNPEAIYCRYIKWEDEFNSVQEYWIGAGQQKGIWTIPATPPAVTAKMKLKITGPDGDPEGTKEIAYDPGVKSGATTVSSAVIAQDVQPRWASDEVQSIGLALLDSNLVACARTQGGLLAPWMEGECKDEACVTTKLLYGASTPYWPERIEFHWNEAAWRQQLAEKGHKSPMSVKCTRADGALLFELSTTNWVKEGALTIPLKWRSDLYSPRPILRMYHLQSISFQATNTAWVGGFPEAMIPSRIILRDCRPSNEKHRGLTIMYIATNSLLSNTSALYKTLVSDALFYDNNAIRRDLSIPTLDRKGVPWNEKPTIRRVVIMLLIVPQCLFLIMVWRWWSKRRQ